MDAIGTALSGMQASVARLNASANNIANANSNGPLASAGSPLANAAAPHVYQPVTVLQSPLATGGVAASIVPRTPGYRPVSDPGSPHANAQGMIAAPNVDLVDEMISQLTAKLTYDANLSVMKTADQMQQHIIERWA